jgi:cytochrome c553
MDGFEGSESTPRIGGKPAAYLAAQLHAFHSGERERANRTMSLIAKILKDEQIDDVAAWYASRTATPVLPDGYSMSAAPDQCFGCHGPNGIARRQDVPNLAGDGRVYLEAQMEAFRSGERESEATSTASSGMPQWQRQVTNQQGAPVCILSSEAQRARLRGRSGDTVFAIPVRGAGPRHIRTDKPSPGPLRGRRDRRGTLWYPGQDAPGAA